MKWLYIVLLCAFSTFSCGEAQVSDPYEDVSVDLEYSLLPGGARIVSGLLHNPTPEVISAAQIQISLFDKNNVRISGMSITIKDIPSGESKPFRQAVDSDLDVHGASVKNILVL